MSTDEVTRLTTMNNSLISELSAKTKEVQELQSGSRVAEAEAITLKRKQKEQEEELLRLRSLAEQQQERPKLAERQPDLHWVEAAQQEVEKRREMQPSDSIDEVTKKLMRDAKEKEHQKVPVVFTLEDKQVRHNVLAWPKFLYEGGAACRRDLTRDLQADFALLRLTGTCQPLEDLGVFLKTIEETITRAREAKECPKRCIELAWTSIRGAEEKMKVLQERLEEKKKKAVEPKGDATAEVKHQRRGGFRGGRGHRPYHVGSMGFVPQFYMPQPAPQYPYQTHGAYGGQQGGYQGPGPRRGLGGRGGRGGDRGRPF